METRTSSTSHYIEPVELNGIKQITGQLMYSLQQNDIEGAIKCINEINQINDESIFNIVGKITRGLHNAISDLNIPTENQESSKNKTRAGLNYVMEITGDAAHKTLNMTEEAQNCIGRVNANLREQTALLAAFGADSEKARIDGFLHNMGRLVDDNQSTLNEISGKVTEIVLAQNFQDLASQSIAKAIKIINEVESSLVMLTQYTRMLQQLSQYPNTPEAFGESTKEELRNNLEKMDFVGESEHMDQDDVDNLLSSLGF